MTDVSILLLTYNADIQKTKRSLSQLIKQKEIDYEIIISDDCSQNDILDEIKEYLDKKNVRKYHIVKMTENKGTVKNYINALQYASGKYIFATSPGDMLYDEYVLHDFYDFCEQNNCKICFGNALYYSYNNEEVEVIKKLNCPCNPYNFSLNRSTNKILHSFLYGGYILGATYFRERECALKYIREVENHVKYVEDTSTTMAALLDGEKVVYYERKMLWYEYGTGISTQARESRWTKIIRDEFVSVVEYLKFKYPQNKEIDVIHSINTIQSKTLKILKIAFKHPIILVSIWINHYQPKKYTEFGKMEEELLTKIMEGENYASC